MRENPPAPRCSSEEPCPAKWEGGSATLGAEKRLTTGACGVARAGPTDVGARAAGGATR